MASSPTFSARLKTVIKFLLFMEDQPKHRVAEEISPALLMLLPNFLFIVGCISFTTLQYGFHMVILAFASVLLGFLETFHCVFDR
jgi:hypothetical protein